jgi:hypothetical protein
VHAGQDVAKSWSAAYFEAVRRRKAGQRASLLLNKRRLVAVTWRKGEFEILPAQQGCRPQVKVRTCRGQDNLVLRLSHGHPYEPGLVRSVRLLEDGGELWLDVTAWVQVQLPRTGCGLVAGIDPGIIHPVAVAAADQALLVSGRALRAEEFLHLQDQKVRERHLSRKRAPVRGRPGSPRRNGSRRWRRLDGRRRAAEARNRRVIRQASARTARLAVGFAARNRAGRM